MNILSVCPLCAGSCNDYLQDKKRIYLHCDNCDLIHVPKVYHLNAKEEKAEYDKHENDPQDKGYRNFLSRIYEPVISYLDPRNSKVKGLDFGCGPGPTLSVMFEEAGYDVALYDHYYFPNKTVLECRYDFITASEVVEHLSKPREELFRLWDCLNEDGILAIMTKRHNGNCADFSSWHYKNDPSHICYYSEKTFLYLGGILGAEIEFVGDDVCLLKKVESN